MATTRERQELLVRLNQEAAQAHEAAKTKALERGRELPKPPEPLKPEDIEFPRHVYKKGTGKDLGAGLFTAESRLVKSEDELKKLGSGWCESPAEAGTPAEVKSGAGTNGGLAGLLDPESPAGRQAALAHESAESHAKKVK